MGTSPLVEIILRMSLKYKDEYIIELPISADEHKCIVSKSSRFLSLKIYMKTNDEKHLKHYSVDQRKERQLWILQKIEIW